MDKTGSIDTYKFQKLVYYCQAWHLVWEDEPLFGEQVQAWANGPVVRELYSSHRGQYSVSAWPKGERDKLTEAQRRTVGSVMGFYGDMSGFELSQLTHREPPWRDARKGLRPGQPSDREITLAAMLEYYGGLVAVDDD